MFLLNTQGRAQNNPVSNLKGDTIITSKFDSLKKVNWKDSLRFNIKDRRSDFLSQPSRNPFDLRDTTLLKRNVEYDPKTKQYVITEKIKFINCISIKLYCKLT